MTIGIIRSGYVGATAAAALITRSCGREIFLTDKKLARAQAEANDILHAVPFAHPLQVSAAVLLGGNGSPALLPLNLNEQGMAAFQANASFTRRPTTDLDAVANAQPVHTDGQSQNNPS